MATPTCIRVIAICLVRRGEELLVFEGYDATKGTFYYRPLGGGVEPGERAADALVRELREELNTDVANVRQLAVLENVFTLDGLPKHEIVFVFEGELTNRSIYERHLIDTVEDNGGPMRVVWRSLDTFGERHRLVPEGLIELARAASPCHR